MNHNISAIADILDIDSYAIYINMIAYSIAICNLNIGIDMVHIYTIDS